VTHRPERFRGARRDCDNASNTKGQIMLTQFWLLLQFVLWLLAIAGVPVWL
jgi:hypothetical protein